MELTVSGLDADEAAGSALESVVVEEQESAANRVIDVPSQPIAAAKRALDIVLSAIGLVALAPLLLAILALIVVTSPGNPIFAQPRVGRGGVVFRMYKLRTMVRDAEARLGELAAFNEAQPPLFKMRRDPRVTLAGRFLRASSLDELLQLVNVLKGEMSLVGPRPPLPHEVATYTPTQARRLSTVPGLTGLWQVSGRSECPFERAIELDLAYIDDWSFWLDIRILLRTVLVVLRSDGAY